MREIERSHSTGLQLDYFTHHGWTLHLLRWLVPLPGVLRPYRGPYGDWPDLISWGFTFSDERTLHLHWGPRSRVIFLPWDWKRVRVSVWREDGSWVPESQDYSLPVEEQPDGRWVGSFPYRYVCNDGTIQSVTATVYVEEREFRWRWLTWLPWPRKVRRSISVSFDQEVGDARGSWKGGCVGCGYEMLPGETPGETLRRMESERRFR